MGTKTSASLQPYIPEKTQLREFTWRALIVGTVLGMVFGASSLYLVLKVGITVSASIPVAVISVTLFKLLAKVGVREATILEHNISQTAGSAGESLAFGVGVTMPAILILGFDLEIMRVMCVALLGGLLGVLMMIPLRRAMIVEQHGLLKYPEGTACAEVLKAGASEESIAAADPFWRSAAKNLTSRATSATTIFAGFLVGLAYKTANVALKGWKDTVGMVFGEPLKGGSLSCEISPELVGVGYIIGPRIAGITFGGGVLAYLVLIPLIKFFGESLTSPLAPGTKLISSMGPDEVRGAYILYIGAGAVAGGGLISLLHALPLIWRGLRAGLKDFSGSRVQSGATERRDTDLSMKVVLIGLVLIIAAIMLIPTLHMKLLGALLIVAFGFLFVTVSSRLTGEIGSSSNPISGMTVATLLMTCLIFLAIGWTGSSYYVTALSVGAIVCIASSNGGTTSQDLKTGFLIGGTPRLQQISLFVGVIASALILGPILLAMNDSSTVYVPAAQVATSLKADPSTMSEHQGLKGPQARDDAKQYLVFHKTSTVGGPAGKYLMNDAGEAVYYVDPGINGTAKKRPDGTAVQKFQAPKATLMSYIIKGILNRELPWGLVILGFMIAVVLELSGIPSLAFAVGVYLPIATSAPLFVGGMIRWYVDRRRRAELLVKHGEMDEDTLSADADRSPGVLASSGYIAGGAIAGIVIAITSGFFEGFDLRVTNWAEAGNPFFNGPYSDALSLIPFVLMVVFLLLVGREKILAGGKKG